MVRRKPECDLYFMPDNDELMLTIFLPFSDSLTPQFRNQSASLPRILEKSSESNFVVKIKELNLIFSRKIVNYIGLSGKFVPMLKEN